MLVILHRISLSSEENGKWKTLEGTFVLSAIPDCVVLYLEGPNPGSVLLIKSVTISTSTTSVSELTIYLILELYMVQNTNSGLS